VPASGPRFRAVGGRAAASLRRRPESGGEPSPVVGRRGHATTWRRHQARGEGAQVAAEKIGEEIRRAVEASKWPDLRIQTRPTVSVGVATYTKDTPIEAEALYVAVDLVRARAKETRNKVVSAVVPEAT
jgi:GGDEF domain-containing protein